MRKLILSLAAVAAFGLALPLTAPAQAEEGRVVIKSGDRHHDRYHARHHGRDKVVIMHRDRHDRGMHRGWRKHHASGARIRVRTD